MTEASPVTAGAGVAYLPAWAYEIQVRRPDGSVLLDFVCKICKPPKTFTARLGENGSRELLEHVRSTHPEVGT